MPMAPSPALPPAPPAPPAPSLRGMVRGLFVMRGLPTRRWPFALRCGVAMGLPMLLGVLAGDPSAGLMAATGGFTALYGSGRPYLRRATELALIALAFAVAVGVGIAIAPHAWLVVPVVAMMAMLATWIGNALRIGPPGAYMFLLACAAGTAMHAPHLNAWHAGLLVLGGGAIAWLLHMGGVLFWPRGPEKSAVTAAARSVGDFVEAVGTQAENSARHRAAMALHDAWEALVSFQPASARADGTLGRLRALNRELHLLFADAVGAASRGEPISPQALVRARELTAQVARPSVTGEPLGRVEVPLGHPDALAALRDALLPGTPSRGVILRVGVAALAAGALGAVFHLERSYWAVAAAVLMLHTGLDWTRMLHRSVERLTGTWIGLLLAGAILSLHPQGVWLVATVVALQFTIEMLVMRNYALAVIFITSAALTIASGGHRIDDLGGYLLARGVDTLVGCAIALLVFRLLAPRRAAERIPAQIAHAFVEVGEVVRHLAHAEVTTPAARVARRDLQRRSFALAQAYDDALVATQEQRRRAEELWPALAATERLVYRTLSAAWALEKLGGPAARDAATTMLNADDAAHVRSALAALASAVHGGAPVKTLPPLPAVLAPELHAVHDSLLARAVPPRDPLARHA
ncbi:FUSC family protein [Lysobacter olei]